MAHKAYISYKVSNGAAKYVTGEVYWEVAKKGW